MPISVTAKLKMKLPNLDFTKDFKEIADKIIIPDIQFGINRSIGIDNKAFPALEPSTIAAKTGVRKKAKKSGGFKKAGIQGAGGGAQPLVDTGRLRESFESQSVGRNHIRVRIASDREKIAYFLQVAGVGKKKKKFNFFGISQRAEFQAISKMKSVLDNVLGKLNGG